MRWPTLSGALAAHRHADAIAAAGVVDEELAVRLAELGVPAAHRLVVRKDPVARIRGRS